MQGTVHACGGAGATASACLLATVRICLAQKAASVQYSLPEQLGCAALDVSPNTTQPWLNGYRSNLLSILHPEMPYVYHELAFTGAVGFMVFK